MFRSRSRSSPIRVDKAGIRKSTSQFWTWASICRI